MGTYYTDFSGASTLTHTTFNTELAKLDGYVSALSDIADAMYAATIGGSYAAASGTTSNYHTPVVAGAKANETTFNALFAGIDSEIGDVVTRLGSLNGNITTETNHHTAISSGANGTIDTFNDPVGELDAELTRVNAILDAIDAWTLANADYFVDSVAGDDGNAGTSSAAPFETLSAVTLADDVIVALKRGSEWTESLSSEYNNVTIIAYGSGAAPIIDASDTVTSWAKTGGRTNVYEATVVTEACTIPYFNAFEDGEFLERVADVATCDSTAGSYYPSSNSGTVTLYVHTTNSDNPASNGSAYRATVREYGIRSNDGAVIIGINTKRPLRNDGSISLDDNATIINCAARQGNKHCMRVGEGSAVYNTLADECYFGGAQYTNYIGYTDVATDGDIDFYYCQAQQASYAYSNNSRAFYTHRGSSGSFGSVSFNNCKTVNVEYGYDVLNAPSYTLAGCAASGGKVGARFQIDGTISNCTLSTDQSAGSALKGEANGITLTVTSSTLTATQNPNTGVVDCGTYEIDLGISGCTITSTTSASTGKAGIYLVDSLGSITSQNNTIADCYRGYDAGAHSTMIYSDNNTFDNVSRCRIASNEFGYSIAGYIAATIASATSIGGTLGDGTQDDNSTVI